MTVWGQCDRDRVLHVLVVKSIPSYSSHILGCAMMMSPMMHPPPSHAVGGSHRYAAEAYMQLLSRALSMGGGDALAAQVWRCVGMGSLGSSSTMCVCPRFSCAYCTYSSPYIHSPYIHSSASA